MLLDPVHTLAINQPCLHLLWESCGSMDQQCATRKLNNPLQVSSQALCVDSGAFAGVAMQPCIIGYAVQELCAPVEIHFYESLEMALTQERKGAARKLHGCTCFQILSHVQVWVSTIVSAGLAGTHL